MNLLIIGNPIAGRGKTSQRVEKLAGLLKHNGHRVEVFLSEKPGDASLRAASIAADLHRIVVAGGDGTLNEVLNGLVDPSALPIVHMPSGTANMLARELNIPTKVSDVARLVDTGHILRIDMGLASGRRFLLVAGVGFDSFVTLQLKEMRGQTLGYRGYLKPIIKASLGYYPTNVKVWVDDLAPITGQMAMVLKTRYYGGVFVFAEEARLDSGFFHIRVFPRGTRSAILKYGVAGLIRKISRLSEVTCLKGRRVRIEAEAAVPVQLDGDHCGWTPVEMEIQPGVVPMVVPPRYRYN
jgi:YegS/Rv2252/BmrU family lipid kinase